MTEHADTGWFRKSRPSSTIPSIERFIDNHIFRGKNGGYGLCFRFVGIDDESLTRKELDDVVKRIGVGAIQQLPHDITFYSWALHKCGFEIPRQKHYPTPEVERVVSTRIQFLHEQGELGANALCWGLYINPPLGKRSPEDNAVQNVRRIRTLRNAATILRTQIADLLQLELMPASEVKGFFGYLLTLESYLATSYPANREHVDEQLARASVTWTEDGLRIGKRYVKLFSMVKRPTGTRPNLFGELLTLNCDLVVAMQWQKRASSAANKEVQRQESYLGIVKEKLLTRVAHGKRKIGKTAGSVAASKTTDKLGAIVSDIVNDGRRYGKFSLIAMLHSRSLEALEAAVPEVHRIFLDPSQAVALEETTGCLSTYHALFPGNQKWNVRDRAWLKDEHFGNLAFPYQPAIGTPWSDDLGNEYVAVYETRDRTPFFLDPYLAGLRGLLILGAPGRGKSMNCNLLVDHEPKYQGFTTIYDIGFSYAATVLSHGGTVVGVGPDGPRMNPFAHPLTDRHIQAIFNLIRTFLEQGGYQMDPKEEQGIIRKIRGIYQFPRELRRLKHLMLPPHMQPYLSKWIEGGIYGALFDNVEDQLELTRLQAFDFEGITKQDNAMIEPTLYWLTWLKESQRHDPQYLGLPKHDVFDELHKHLTRPQMWEFLLSDLKTSRKHLGGLTLLTHHLDDLGQNASLIINACPMRMFLGGDVDRKRYIEAFKLNDTKVDIIESLGPRELFLDPPGKVLRLNLDPMSYAKYTTRPKDRVARLRMIEEHGQRKGLELFAQELRKLA